MALLPMGNAPRRDLTFYMCSFHTCHQNSYFIKLLLQAKDLLQVYEVYTETRHTSIKGVKEQLHYL